MRNKKMMTFTQYLNEGCGFELGGSKYSSGFGRYTKDGKSISKEEYMKASAQYKGYGNKNSSSKSVNNTTMDNSKETPRNYSKVINHIDSTVKDMESKIEQLSEYIPQNDRHYTELEVMKDSMVNLKDIISDIEEYKNKGLSDRQIIRKIDGLESKYSNYSVDYMISDLLLSYEKRFKRALFYLE